MIKSCKYITLITLLLVAAGCNYQKTNNMTQIPTTTSKTILAPDTSELKQLEQVIHQQVNQYRQSQNLPPLTLNSTISEQAKIHSQNMAVGKVPFSHEGFEGRVKAIPQTITYRSAAENVATNYGYSDPATQAVKGWINSPGHQENMVGDFNLTGLGVAKDSEGKYYFTQMFIRSR